MNKRRGNKNRKNISSAIMIVVSITLILFVLGIMGILILNVKKLSDHIKENIALSIIISDFSKETEIKRIQKLLDVQHSIISTRYITKNEAIKEFKKEMGEDFVDALDYNPLLASIEVKLHTKYANVDSIQKLEKKLLGYPEVKEVYYQKNLIHLVNDNVRKISLGLFLFSTILLLISFSLINNTIRLAIYAQRFKLNTMQLVGATDNFIRYPFINMGILRGFLAAVLAIIMLAVVLYIIQNQVSEFTNLINNINIFIILGALLLIIGISFPWIATYISVNVYLRRKTTALY